MTFLKIISFPIRLVLFTLFALLTLIVSVINNTFVMFLNLAAAVIAFLGSIFTGLMILGVIASIIIEVAVNGGLKSVHDTVTSSLFSTGLALLFGFVCVFMPIISSYLFAILLKTADWLWAFSKMILLCDIDELNYA